MPNNKFYAYHIAQVCTVETPDTMAGTDTMIEVAIRAESPETRWKPIDALLVLPYEFEATTYVDGKETIGQAIATIDDTMDHLRRVISDEVSQGALYSLQQRRNELAELLEPIDK